MPSSGFASKVQFRPLRLNRAPSATGDLASDQSSPIFDFPVMRPFNISQVSECWLPAQI